MNDQPYAVEFLAQAMEDLDDLDKSIIQRVLNKLRSLAENFDSVRPEGLTGSLAGLFKLRVGDYRVIYQVDRKNRKLTVHMVGHRKEIYKHR